ncbi:hypothetical protein ACEWL3_004210 [Sulfitobacter sp. MF3-043]
MCFFDVTAFAEASFVTPFSFVGVNCAALYDMLFFNVIPDDGTRTGAVPSLPRLCCRRCVRARLNRISKGSIAALDGSTLAPTA